MYYYSFMGHLWDISMSHKLRDFFGTLLGLIKPQINAHERRFVILTHRKGREERKAQLHKFLYLEEIIRPGTLIPRIERIYTDHQIGAHPRQPLRQLTSAITIRGEWCSIPFRDSGWINNELVRTETNSGHSKFGG